jgi:hypothetical protein
MEMWNIEEKNPITASRTRQESQFGSMVVDRMVRSATSMYKIDGFMTCLDWYVKARDPSTGDNPRSEKSEKYFRDDLFTYHIYGPGLGM